jgi:hypothetical protein
LRPSVVLEVGAKVRVPSVIIAELSLVQIGA